MQHKHLCFLIEAPPLHIITASKSGPHAYSDTILTVPCFYRLNFIFSLHRSYLCLVHPAVWVPKIELVHESVHTCAFQLCDSFEMTSFAALMSSVQEYHSFLWTRTEKHEQGEVCGLCVLSQSIDIVHVPRLDRHLDRSGWEE